VSKFSESSHFYRGGTALTLFPKYLDHFSKRNEAFPFYLTTHRLDKGYPPHRHDFLEFLFVIEGQGTEVIDGIVHPLIPGSFTFILPYQIHEIRPEPGAVLKLYNCNFELDLLIDSYFEPFVKELMHDDSQNLSSFVQFDDEEASWMLETLKVMRLESKDNQIWNHALLRIKLMEILIKFDRVRHRTCLDNSHDEASGGSKIVWKIIRYIHDHYREEITLSALSEQFHLSKSTLSKLFKNHVGSNYLDFLHEVRTRHACSMLLSTDMSISQISYEVGYGSYQTFSRVFLEQKGITPSTYRENKKCKA
jgi:AraC-like DNA-binding protein/mannose-6-phosphate isomerase-like protein (cupin superfamily)